MMQMTEGCSFRILVTNSTPSSLGNSKSTRSISTSVLFGSAQNRSALSQLPTTATLCCFCTKLWMDSRLTGLSSTIPIFFEGGLVSRSSAIQHGWMGCYTTSALRINIRPFSIRTSKLGCRVPRFTNRAQFRLRVMIKQRSADAVIQSLWQLCLKRSPDATIGTRPQSIGVHKVLRR